VQADAAVAEDKAHTARPRQRAIHWSSWSWFWAYLYLLHPARLVSILSTQRSALSDNIRAHYCELVPQVPEMGPAPERRAVPAVGNEGNPRKHHERSFKYKNDGKVLEPFAPAEDARSALDDRLEVRVRITIFTVRDVDLVEQTFVCKFFLEVSWMDTAIIDAMGTCHSLEVDSENSDWRRGILVLKGDQKHYYFAPKVKFENLVRSSSTC
jgi:hypothetical protein